MDSVLDCPYRVDCIVGLFFTFWRSLLSTSWRFSGYSMAFDTTCNTDHYLSEKFPVRFHVQSFRTLKSTTPIIVFRKLDVRGSVHYTIIHIGNPTRCNSASQFYFIFIWRSTCFWRHTAHHQEHCTFSYSTWQGPATTRPTTLHVCKTRGC